MLGLMGLVVLINFHPSASTNKERVYNVPFATMYRERKKLHIIDDYFRLVQHIDLQPIIMHLNSITKHLSVVSTKFRNIPDAPKGLYPEIEKKLKLVIEHLALNIAGGIQMLPHDERCEVRIKRGIEIEDDPVNTFALFPEAGKLFSWVTGSLSSDAGRYINQNFHNIQRLTKMSVNFAQMFNHTLNIEKKHSDQLMQLHNEVTTMHIKLD